MDIFKRPDAQTCGIPSLGFNCGYDQELIRKLDTELYNSLYETQRKYEETQLQMTTTLVYMNEFMINIELNKACELPINSVSIQLEKTFIRPNLYDEKLSYKPLKERIYNILDTYKYSNIFNSSLDCYIDNWLFIGLKIIPCKQYTYLVITDDQSGLSNNVVNDMIKNKTRMVLYTQKAFNLYRHEAVGSDLLVMNEGFPKSYISDNSYANKGSDKVNQYRLYITDPDAGSSNLLNSTFSKLVTGTYGPTFSINNAYNSIIRSSGNKLKIIIMNDPLRVELPLSSYHYFCLSNTFDYGIPIANCRFITINGTTENISIQSCIDINIEDLKYDCYKISTYPADCKMITYITEDGRSKLGAQSKSIDTACNQYIQYLSNKVSDGIDTEIYPKMIEANSCDNEFIAHMNISSNYPELDTSEWLSKVEENFIDDIRKGITHSEENDLPEVYQLNCLKRYMNNINIDKSIEIYKHIKNIQQHNIIEFTIDLLDSKFYNILNHSIRNIKPQTNINIEYPYDMWWISFHKRTNQVHSFDLFIDGQLYTNWATYCYKFNQYIYVDKSIVDNATTIKIIMYTQDSSTKFKTSTPLVFNSVNRSYEFPTEFKHFSSRNIMFYSEDSVTHKKTIYPNNNFTLYLEYGFDPKYLLTDSGEYAMTKGYVYNAILTMNGFTLQEGSGTPSLNNIRNITGIGHVDVKLTLTGNETIIMTSKGDNVRFQFTNLEGYAPKYEREDTICFSDKLPMDYSGTVSNISTAKADCFIAHSTGIYITITGSSPLPKNVDDMKAYLAIHPITIWYKSGNYETSKNYYTVISVTDSNDNIISAYGIGPFSTRIYDGDSISIDEDTVSITRNIAYITYTGIDSEKWQYNKDAKYFYVSYDYSENVICNQYPKHIDTQNGYEVDTKNHIIKIYDLGYTSLAAFLNRVQGNNLVFVANMQTPIKETIMLEKPINPIPANLTYKFISEQPISYELNPIIMIEGD